MESRHETLHWMTKVQFALEFCLVFALNRLKYLVMQYQWWWHSFGRWLLSIDVIQVYGYVVYGRVRKYTGHYRRACMHNINTKNFFCFGSWPCEEKNTHTLKSTTNLQVKSIKCDLESWKQKCHVQMVKFYHNIDTYSFVPIKTSDPIRISIFFVVFKTSFLWNRYDRGLKVLSSVCAVVFDWCDRFDDIGNAFCESV